MHKSIRRDVYIYNSFESLLNITALLVRLAQTITKIYRNKILWFVFPRKKEIIVQTMNILLCTSVNISTYLAMLAGVCQCGVQHVETFFKPRQSIRPICFWTWLDKFFKHYWLFIQEIRCIGATLGLWKGFQARSYMYTCERKAFP